MDFCKCGSIRINEECSNAHCPSKSKKHKDWVVNGRTMDFKKPVSYVEATEFARRLTIKEKNI